MRKIFILFATFFLSGFEPNLSAAQTWKYVYRDSTDRKVNCYLLYLPKSQNIRGLIVRDFSTLPDTLGVTRSKLHLLAAEHSLATAFTVTTSVFPELYYKDSLIELLDDITHEILAENNISQNNLFMGGLSAGGTRALRFAQYCNEGKSKYGTRVRGVFAVDSPLDIERFYYSAERGLDRFKLGMLEEAKIVLRAFPEQLGTLPSLNPEVYRKASVFSYRDAERSNARHFRNQSIVMYHEPDMDWWLNERGCDYYDINSFDMTGFINTLRAMGNKDVELITTTGKGYDKAGNRNCHSWSIVDEPALIKWIVQRMK